MRLACARGRLLSPCLAAPRAPAALHAAAQHLFPPLAPTLPPRPPAEFERPDWRPIWPECWEGCCPGAWKPRRPDYDCEEHRRPRWPVAPVWCLPPEPVYGYKASLLVSPPSLCLQQAPAPRCMQPCPPPPAAAPGSSRPAAPAAALAVAVQGARWPPAAAATWPTPLPALSTHLPSSTPQQDEYICRPEREYGWDSKPVFGALVF